MKTSVDIFIDFAENQMYQVRAILSDSEDGSSPSGHGDSQEYHDHNTALKNAYLWSALILSEQYNSITVFDEGSEIAFFDSEMEAHTAYRELQSSKLMLAKNTHD